MAWTTHWIGILRQNNKYRHLLRFGLLMLIWLALSSTAWAESLQTRVQAFPHWSNLPTVQPAQGDLVYPDWFRGTWQVESTLVDLEAPLAPHVITPGFEGNRRYLHQPLTFQVRFLPPQLVPGRSSRSFWRSWQQTWQGWLPEFSPKQAEIVADRAFNGFNIAQAYLGNTDSETASQVESVVVDQNNPNRQVTTFRQDSQTLQLVTIVTDRARETPADDRSQFLTTEISQQFFRSRPQIYLNRVETTTAYQFDPDRQRIEAEQFTAVYLSPEDPQYFQALDQPVALYHYHLNLQPNHTRTQ
jgi:hypothetical protein